MNVSCNYRQILLTALFLVILVPIASSADGHQLRRQVAPKQPYTALPEGANPDLIVLKLREGTARPEVDNGRFLKTGHTWDQLNEIIATGDKVEQLRPRLKMDVAKLDEMRAEGSRRVGWQLPDMTLYFQIKLRAGLSDTERLDVLNNLIELDLIETAYFSPVPCVLVEELDADFEADAEIDSETPGWEHLQYYLQPAPIGFDAYYAWSFPGGRGEDVLAIHLEGNWTETHEDLRGGTQTFHISGEKHDDSVSLAHGTSMVGIVAADSNTFGTTGIAYNVDLGTVAIVQDFIIANDILTAATASEVGDIIFMALGGMIGPSGSGSIVLEYLQENFDAILTASALGRIVVEAAGNGNTDYDDTDLFGDLFDPDYRFSGAIFVGDAYVTHIPTGRSNYGERLDVHGFGAWDIYTHGWGHLYGDTVDNYYTGWFSGTSAASAEIAGVCAALQGVYKAHNATPLDHSEMRRLLTTYSVPQADHYKRIGPMPDLAGACNEASGFVRPATPDPVAPADGAYFDTPATLIFSWNAVAGAISYDIQIDDNKDFSSPVAQQDGVSATDWTAPPLESGQYYWRVRANNVIGFGSWSYLRKVRVGVDLQAPVCFAPVDGDVLKNQYNLPLQWYRIEGVTDYLVDVLLYNDTTHWYRKSSYSFACEDEICSAGIYQSMSGSFYWRVRALGDEWPWSDLETFKLVSKLPPPVPQGPKKSIAETGGKDIDLLGNYPNPFNPDTEIGFSIAEPGHVRLRVYNILGQEVATLVDQYLNAGDYTARWDGSQAASGIYLYSLETATKSISRKMLLLK